MNEMLLTSPFAHSLRTAAEMEEVIVLDDGLEYESAIFWSGRIKWRNNLLLTVCFILSW